jgi:DNA polymerase-1
MAEQDQRPLFVLDGMSLAFRAFYALPPDLATSGGLVTNAVHGFASMLLSLVRDHDPSGIAVAFDLPGGTFRDEMVEEYKGGRAETPEELLPQFDLIRDMVQVLGIPIFEIEGYEADDVLATLATRARDEGRPVVVVTGDRDCFQLVEDPFVRVLYNRRGVSDYSLYDEAGIIERTGIEPRRYPMLAALRGDPSDNLPGVPGVGEKTAAKLLTTYRDLDGIFSHLDELTPKLRENLAANETLARRNLEVMRLVRDTPIDVDPASLHLGGWDLGAAQSFYESLELKQLWRRTAEALGAGRFGPSAEGSQDEEPAAQGSPLEAEVATRAEGAALTKVLEGVPQLIALSATAVTLAASSRAGGPALVVLVDAPEARAILSSGQPIAALDVKRILRLVLRDGTDPVDPVGDASIAGYLLDAAAGTYDLRSLLGRHLPDVVLATSDPGGAGQLALGGEEHAEDLAAELVAIGALLDALEPQLAQEGLDALYREIELPLTRVLARMEDRGIAVDVQVLRAISDDLTTRAAALETSVQELAGHAFTVNSTKQLQQVLFEELDLPKGRKTKTGYSTDAATLEGLVGTHPIVEEILAFREVEKLRSTYGESLLAEVAPDGRIHATFRQTVARTGRLSSESPNLHNIPVRSDEGRRFRMAFIPTAGWDLLVADYDQVELRIIAHLASDPGLIRAFEAGTDIHRAVAADVFGVTPDAVSYEQRERAKMVSYGLAYGMEAFGLARRLGGDVGAAREIMDRYFAAYPGVKRYMDDAVGEARAQGFTRTALGRIRPLPELTSGNRNQQAAAERQAMNAGIQGLAADLFKVALVRLDRRLADEGLEARIVLQVHDEVLVEAPPVERDAVEAATREVLEGAAELAVPLEVSLGWGSSWAAAKG